jgi:hypothetical protein
MLRKTWKLSKTNCLQLKAAHIPMIYSRENKCSNTHRLNEQRLSSEQKNISNDSVNVFQK